MNRPSLTNINSILTTVLLLSQVVLSVLIIVRINRLDEIMTKSSVQPPAQPSAPIYVPDVSIDDDPMIGNTDALVTIIEFSDFQCPFCAQVQPEIKSILTEFSPSIRLVYRDFPLINTHQDAFQAALAANCANKQSKFWEMHDTLFSNQDNLKNDNLKSFAMQLNLNLDEFSTCLDNSEYANEILNDMKDAQQYQVNATPTFFVNGLRVVGIEMLRETILSQLKDAKGGE